MKKPNIILITTDQQSHNTIGANGNMYIDTPNMDYLSKTGTTYTSAYCSFPLCTPSRASLFTGLLPHDVNVLNNGEGLTDRHKKSSLGVLLRKNEYECAYGGKWHVPKISMPENNDLGFDVICNFNDNNLADNCIKYLSKEHKKPFFLSINFDNPHNICEWARQQELPWGNVDDTDTKNCPPLPTNFGLSAYEPEAILASTARFPQFYGVQGMASTDRWRHYRHAYYRLIEKVDKDIGKILNGLEQNGFKENTVVIFTSDHGDAQSAHMLRQKTFLYDEQTHIPLIVSDFRNPKQNKCDIPVCNGTDILPTILSFAGVEYKPKEYCRDLKDHRKIKNNTVLTQTNIGYDKQNRTFGRMIRTPRYKYIVYNWGQYREQLFDLKSDPGETVNLALCNYHNDTLNEHRNIMIDMCEKYGDNVNIVPKPIK